MLGNDKELYRNLHGYITGIVENNSGADRVVDVLIKAEVPLQTFVTATKLYNIVQTKLSSNEISSNRHCVIAKEDRKILENQYLSFVSCLMIASKYYRDIAFTNESWEYVSNVSKNTLNQAERASLEVLDYQVSSLGDSVVMKSITTSLKAAGFKISAARFSSVGKMKGFFRKILCLS